MGYTGGDRADPTYESVCRGDGHTEALKIEYDPSVISYEELMKRFFAENQHGGGKKQYMSAVWAQDEAQAASAKAAAMASSISATPTAAPAAPSPVANSAATDAEVSALKAQLEAQQQLGQRVVLEKLGALSSSTSTPLF